MEIRKLTKGDMNSLIGLYRPAAPRRCDYFETAGGRGLGRMVIEKIVELAKGRGCYKVMLTSSMHRTEAHKFYAAKTTFCKKAAHWSGYGT